MARVGRDRPARARIVAELAGNLNSTELVDMCVVLPPEQDRICWWSRCGAYDLLGTCYASGGAAVVLKAVVRACLPAGPHDLRLDQVVYYQYRAERTRRSRYGIDQQIAKAENAVAGKAPVKRNRFIALRGAEKSVNRILEAMARALAGWKGYTTNLTSAPTARRSPRSS